VSNIKGFKRAYLAVMMGTPEQVKKYCTKQDKNAFECGEMPINEPGKRTDLHLVTSRILKGERFGELLDEENAGTFVKFHRGLQFLRNLVREKEAKIPPFVVWLYGPTGRGKTRSAYNAGCALFGKQRTWISEDKLEWFEGYDGQDLVVFDDFRSKSARFPQLLRLLDRYEGRVPIKGTSAPWNPKIICVTTPNDVEDTFSVRAMHRPEDIKQVKRRIHLVIAFSEDDEEDRWEKARDEIQEKYLEFKEKNNL